MTERITITYSTEIVPQFPPMVLSKETLELMDRVRRDIDAAMNSLVFEQTVDHKANVVRTRTSWLLPISSDIA